MTMDSMPARCRRWARTSPAGPAPTMPICVRMSSAEVVAQERRRPAVGKVCHRRIVAWRADAVEGVFSAGIGVNLRPAGEAFDHDRLRLARDVTVLFRYVEQKRFRDLRCLADLLLDADAEIADIALRVAARRHEK